MKKYFLVALLTFASLASCSKNDDADIEEPVVVDPVEEPEPEPELNRADYPVQDFMYQAMNVYYLYKPDIEVLADDYFTDLPTYVTFLSENPVPEDFYDSLLSSQDRFSFLTDNYIELENSFSGISKTDGLNLEFAAYQTEANGPQYAFAIIRYVTSNSPASEKKLTRGTLITKINGERLTITNGRLSPRAVELLNLDSYTLGLAKITDNTIDESANSEVNLVKVELTENPIHIAKTLEIDGQKIGYLMYNSFVSNFDDELNASFAQFKADGITDLVLDLRYNGGGSVATAVDLTSMITGQFEDQILTKQQWNPEAQAYFEAEAPESLLSRFNSTIYTGTNFEEPINSLNLSRLFVIGTGSTASASELTIIGLRPYIEVKTIGKTTVGKFQASATLYDGDDFLKKNVNPNHTYAIQPLIYTYRNANDVVGPPTGIVPDVPIEEDITNFGELGNPTEPLLSAALSQITGKSYTTKQKSGYKFKILGESGMDSPTYQRMYDNRLPQIKK